MQTLQDLASARDAGWEMRGCAEGLLSIARDFLNTLDGFFPSISPPRDTRLPAMGHAETSGSPAMNDGDIPSYDDIAASLARELEWEGNGETLESLAMQGSMVSDPGGSPDSLSMHGGGMTSDPGGSPDSLTKRLGDTPVKRQVSTTEFDERKRMAKAKQVKSFVYHWKAAWLYLWYIALTGRKVEDPQDCLTMKYDTM